MDCRNTSDIKKAAEKILSKLSKKEVQVIEDYFSILYSNKRSRVQFSAEEDSKLRELVKLHGCKDWKIISENMENRSPRQCRDRWFHYLSSEVNNRPFTEDEDNLLRNLFSQFGSKWVIMTHYFVNRSDTNLKNRWIALLRKEAKTKNSTSISESPVQVSPEEFPISDDFGSFLF
ncbi:Myb-like DNA-binding domain containing protein [Trichomonas vaginalis G3]|uniref:Myb-like DNA-binding domain containing protein n=1 Tax=Trichomonas vaginalis (strain ATCC PRA-98 / G3) TaxID=412133 RepID=A2DIR4_TRIV3|nr:RNA polymerase II transcription regulator recruiting protein [Trichomonas vaginalis G3]EAY19677.1 Myb-like DNA-binding domain containing protein [Trichomonas vaginalis G3]KAI5521303.1 RNA polymerase II transcription regulator recruiting protein [Trichomonas vaginalis G3]|eukprot:XP_001580663.1 Myb-like DNA-binding domain containing protein [Trichomonas vaginalis G3]